MSKNEEIKSFWDEQAKTHANSYLATNPDKYSKDLEISTICEYIEDGQVIADIGCGNGFSCFELAQLKAVNILGVDYSSEMISSAKQTLATLDPTLKQSVHFQEGDVLNLDLLPEQYDVVISDRCLINLTSREQQELAINEIHKVLKPGGLYLMCENTEQGLNNLNDVRQSVGLEPVALRWHNLYLDEAYIHKTMLNTFELVAERNFASFYFLASRVINALQAKENNEEPSYLSDVNRMAAEISPTLECGNYSPLKLFVWRK